MSSIQLHEALSAVELTFREVSVFKLVIFIHIVPALYLHCRTLLVYDRSYCSSSIIFFFLFLW